MRKILKFSTLLYAKPIFIVFVVNCMLQNKRAYLWNIFNVHSNGHVGCFPFLRQLEFHVHGRHADPHLLSVGAEHLLVDLRPGRLQQEAHHRDQDQPQPAAAPREGQREAERGLAGERAAVVAARDRWWECHGW